MKVKILPNGLTVILDKRPVSSAVFAIGSLFGSRFEGPDENGLSHLTEHMILDGHRGRRPATLVTEADLMREMDRFATEYNAMVSEDLFYIYASTERRGAHLTLARLIDCFLRPALTKQNLQKEKGIVEEERARYKDDAEVRAAELLDELIFGSHSLSQTIIGPESVIRKTTVTDVRRLWRRLTRPNRVAIAAVGNFQEEKVWELIRQRFGRLRRGRIAEPIKFQRKQRRPRVRLLSRRTRQITISIGFPVFGWFDEGRIPLAVMNNILGGRDSSLLTLALKREGLVYNVSSGVWHWPDAGTFTISCACQRRKLLVTLACIRKALLRLREEKISRQELGLAIANLKARTRQNQDSLTHSAKLAIGQILAFGEHINARTFCKEVSRVSRGQVQKVARRVIRNSALNLVAIGNVRNGDERKIKKAIRL